MVYALLRQFSGDISLLHQRAMVMGYVRSHQLAVGKEMIEFGSHGKTLQEREQFDAFLHTLNAGDHVIVDEVQTLGQTMEEVITVLNCMLSRDVTLSLASIELKVDERTPLARILPLVMHLDPKKEEEGRRTQKGRPKGSQSASKFDGYLDRIIAYLKEGANVSAIARELEVSRSSLKDYIESRQLKKILDDAWMEKIHAQYRPNSTGTAELICTLNP
jgi:DNA invertase Pin-like site-specific DNA recombinase